MFKNLQLVGGRILSLAVLATALVLTMPFLKASADFGSDWTLKDNAINFKTEKTVYEPDQNNRCHIEVSFDLKSLPEPNDDTSKVCAVYSCLEDPEAFMGDPQNTLCYTAVGIIDTNDLKLSGNKVSFEFNISFDEGENSANMTLWLNEGEVYYSSSLGDYLCSPPLGANLDVTCRFKIFNNDWDLVKSLKNFKTTESEVKADKNNKCSVTVTFDLDSLPEKSEDQKKVYGLYLDKGSKKDDLLFYDYPYVLIKASELKSKGNTYTIDFDMIPENSLEYYSWKYGYSDEENEAPFTLAIFNLDSSKEKTGEPLFKYEFKVVRTSSIDWNVTDMITDVSLDKEFYSLGSEQTITVKFKNSKEVAETDLLTDKTISFTILDESGKVVTSEGMSTDNLKVGTNSFTFTCRFSKKGIYYLKIVQDSGDYMIGSYINGPYEFAVQNAKNENGESVESKDSVSARYSFYSKEQGKQLMVDYSVSDISCDYRLFVFKGNASYYDVDIKKALDNADFMSKLGELPLKFGETQSLSIKTTFKDFGLYTVVLCNLTLNKIAAKDIFYVVPEKYLIQRSMNELSDTGVAPFKCDAKVGNLELDKNKKISFNIEFPINLKNYTDQFASKYGYANAIPDDYFEDGDYDEFDYDEFDEGPSDFSIDDAFFNDDYPVIMTVKYVPEGSKTSRILIRKEITGVYKAHTIDLTAKEIMSAIYDTNVDDIAYAGMVTVEFSNKLTDLVLDGYDGYRDTIYNEAIVEFTEKFSFSVNKAENLKSAKALSKTTERAYGEKAKFIVSDTLGGKIYAVIYKGKKKVATATGKCSLNSDGTAGGIVSWNLKNAGGNYLANGKYKAKIYTKNEYTVCDKNGKQSKKSVTSKKKTVSFTLKKPSGKLSLEASVSGSNGNSIFVENPIICLQFSLSIGSKVTVNVKNSGGSSLFSDNYECGKGSYYIPMNLSGLNLKEGSYKVELKAVTLDGTSKSLSSSFQVKKMPKPSISSASVSADSNTGSGSFSFAVSQPSTVKVEVKSGNTVKQTVINQNYSAGTIKSSFSIGGYTPGNYSLVITATNSGGTATVTKSFEVKKKPVVVKKPTISNLNLRFTQGKDGDQYQGSFNYTGKNAKVVIDIMYNDAEEIVYTFEGTTPKDSGTYTFTWNGFKSNGFKAWVGNYTMRVRLINSAGSTDYLRRNFNIGEG